MLQTDGSNPERTGQLCAFVAKPVDPFDYGFVQRMGGVRRLHVNEEHFLLSLHTFESV